MSENVDPHVATEGPLPFTAAEIRDALRTGVLIRMRTEAPDGTTTARIYRYSAGDDEGTLLESQLDGAPEAAMVRRATWQELQAHAAFPTDRTTVGTEIIEHPLGRLACLRYDVRGDVDNAVFWFSPAHPGMPVRYETTDARGTTRTTVLEITTE